MYPYNEHPQHRDPLLDSVMGDGMPKTKNKST